MSAFRYEHQQSHMKELMIASGIFELCFFIDMITNFFKDTNDSEDFHVSRSFKEVSTAYYKDRFIWDLIPLIPFQYLVLKRNRQRLFFIIKIIRLKNGLQDYSTRNIMKIIKRWQNGHINKLIENYPIESNDKNQDLNLNSEMLYVSFVVKTQELVVIIFLISYIFGILWYIMCEGVEDFYEDVDYRQLKLDKNEDYDEEKKTIKGVKHFITEYDMHENSGWSNVLVCTYFAFTSLTTVGFGDKHPQYELEYVFCSFMLLFGVLMFSYVMSIFVDILGQYKNHINDFDEGDKLIKFFGTLQKFNHNEPIEKHLMVNIERYFDYRWRNYKNNAFNIEEDKAILSELPDHV